MSRRGYFAIPKYSFEETHDADGNPHWKSICQIEGVKGRTSGTSGKKMEAKKKAAYKMLRKVLKGGTVNCKYNLGKKSRLRYVSAGVSV